MTTVLIVFVCAVVLATIAIVFAFICIVCALRKEKRQVQHLQRHKHNSRQTTKQYLQFIEARFGEDEELWDAQSPEKNIQNLLN